jgi:hypothetical protein
LLPSELPCRPPGSIGLDRMGNNARCNAIVGCNLLGERERERGGGGGGGGGGPPPVVERARRVVVVVVSRVPSRLRYGDDARASY